MEKLSEMSIADLVALSQYCIRKNNTILASSTYWEEKQKAEEYNNIHKRAIEELEARVQKIIDDES